MRVLREELGLTQEELAEKIDVSLPQINRYEHGKNNPTSDIIVKIAVALNTSADYLLGLTDDPTPIDLVKGSLSTQERAALSAWRRGDYKEVMKAIAGDK